MGTEAHFEVVSAASLYMNDYNPRRSTVAADDDELLQSIKTKGIIVPLIVRAKANKKGAPYEIVAGSRRHRLGTKAGLEIFPCMVHDLMDDETALEIAIIENLQRAEVKPVDEALGFAKLVKMGKPVAEIASRVGKDPRYVHYRLALAELVPAALKALEDGALPIGHANLIARLPASVQSEALALAFYNQKPDPEDVREMAQFRRDLDQTFHLLLQQAPFPVTAADLVPEAGACTTCPKRAGTQPQLFEDLASGETCLDKVCFAKKAAVFLKAQLKKAGKDAVQLVGPGGWVPYNAKDKNPPISEHNWKRAAPGSCKSATQGVIVDGKGKGSIVGACTNRKCRTHFAAENRETREALTGKKAPDRAKELREKLTREAEEASRKALFAAVLDVAAKEPPNQRGLLDVAAQTIWDIESWGDGAIEMFAERQGWLKRGKHGASPNELEKLGSKLGDLSLGQLAVLFYTVQLHREVEFYTSQNKTTPRLTAAAKFFRLDPKDYVVKPELPAPKRAAAKKKAKKK